MYCRSAAETSITDDTELADGQRRSAGSTRRPELGEGVFSWHFRQSRNRSSAGRVSRPGHFLTYRIDDDTVVIGRVLHDAMDLQRHLDPDTSWE
jgi:toxin ParE1/3/4